MKRPLLRQKYNAVLSCLQVRGIHLFYVVYNVWCSRRKFLTTFLTFSILLLLFYYISSYHQPVTPVEHISKSWHKVFGSTYIYSAFWDERDIPHVKILAVGPYDERLANIQCFVKAGKEAILSDTVFHIMDFENNGMKHTPLFLLCYPVDQRRPTHVALSTSDGEVSTWLPVQTMTPQRNVSDKIAVCVRPIFDSHKGFNVRLVEFVAYYKLIGVSHFVFYDYRADKSTKELLSKLSFNGVSLQLLPWDIPLSVENSWENGQVVSITDCVYRLASNFEFVLIVDIDEFIVPRSNVTLQNIVHSLTGASSHPSASYIFRQSFFCSDFADDPHGRSMPLSLITQTKSFRKLEISPWSSRAKSIVRPMAVILPGIHKVLLTHGKWKSIVFVEPTTAFIHHYRNGVCSFWEKLGYGIMKDTTAFRYRNALLNSLPVRMYVKLYGAQ